MHCAGSPLSMHVPECAGTLQTEWVISGQLRCCQCPSPSAAAEIMLLILFYSSPDCCAEYRMFPPVNWGWTSPAHFVSGTTQIYGRGGWGERMGGGGSLKKSERGGREEVPKGFDSSKAFSLGWIFFFPNEVKRKKSNNTNQETKNSPNNKTKKIQLQAN